MHYKLRFFFYLLCFFMLYGPIAFETFAGGESLKLGDWEKKIVECIVKKMIWSCGCDDVKELCSCVEEYEKTTKQIFDYGAFLPVLIDDPWILPRISTDENVLCAQATLLHIVFYLNSCKILHYLLEKQSINFAICTPTIKIMDWKEAFKQYCDNNEHYLQSRKVDLEQICTLLVGAALHNNFTIARRMFKKGYAPQLSTVQYALHIAVIKNYEFFLALLLSDFPDMDINCLKQWPVYDFFGAPSVFSYVTPLIAAMRCGHEQIVAELLKIKKIDPNKSTEIYDLVAKEKITPYCLGYALKSRGYDLRPLTLAVMYNQPRIVRMLIVYGVKTSMEAMKNLFVTVVAHTNSYDGMIAIIHLCKEAKEILQLPGKSFTDNCNPLCLAVSKKRYNMVFVLWHGEYFCAQPSSNNLNFEALGTEKLMLSTIPEFGRSFPFGKNEDDNTFGMLCLKNQITDQCGPKNKSGEDPLLIMARANNFLAIRCMLSEILALQNMPYGIGLEEDSRVDQWIHSGFYVLLYKDIFLTRRQIMCDHKDSNATQLINKYYSVGDNVKSYLPSGLNRLYEKGGIPTLRLRVTLLFAACQNGHWATVCYLLMQPGINVTAGMKMIVEEKHIDQATKEQLENTEKLYTPYFVAKLGDDKAIMKLLEGHQFAIKNMEKTLTTFGQ